VAAQRRRRRSTDASRGSPVPREPVRGVEAVRSSSLGSRPRVALKAGELGLEADAMPIGDLYEAPSGPAVAALQHNTSLVDLWPQYGAGQGLTTAKARFDYVLAGLNWLNQSAVGTCATVVRTIVKPAKARADRG